MLTRFTAMIAAVLSGVAASLTMIPPAFAAGQDSPVVVYADKQEGLRTERVSYADLNLAEQRDHRRLRARVAGAVKRVCLFDNGRSGLQETSYTRCSDGAWGEANPQIAQAVTRAQEIALTGQSAIPVTAIRITAR